VDRSSKERLDKLTRTTHALQKALVANERLIEERDAAFYERNAALSVERAAIAQHRKAVSELNALKREARYCCGKPCDCGSGIWPCHVDSDKATTLVLSLVRT
jgi:hypothetical protein